MRKEVKFNSKSLLDIKFEKDVKGYNPLQVDQTLDEIIQDYQAYESEIKESDNVIAELNKEINDLKAVLRENEIQIAKSNAKIKNMATTQNYSQDNTDLLKRIDLLERALYKKGVDPKKI